MIIKGRYNECIIHAAELEQATIASIQNYLNLPISQRQVIRIMPDAHAGAGVCIGFTSTMNEYIIPNVIGVDIGCGVAAFKTNLKQVNFEELDNFIRENIPSGFSIRQEYYQEISDNFKNQVIDICERIRQDSDYALKSIGTLGGGNHFIEMSKGQDDYLWIIVHSGSRKFGHAICTYYMKQAKTSLNGITIPTSLAYLQGEIANQYLQDMEFAQEYAKLNRQVILNEIIKFLQASVIEQIESIHNYINFDDKVIRKGAIVANQGEKVVIPMNMAYGSIIGIGKGNQNWNNSAPHGAGRVLSRKQAKAQLSLAEFQEKMQGIYSSCISQQTLDESPMAYKDPDKIVEYLQETVTVQDRLIPVYNFKV